MYKSVKTGYNGPIIKKEEEPYMFTKSQIELQAHIEAKNAEGKKWMDENPGSFYGMTVTDPAHWADQGITTVEQYEYQMEYYGLFDYIAGLTSKGNARYLLSLCTTIDDLNAVYSDFGAQMDIDPAWEVEKAWCEDAA